MRAEEFGAKNLREMARNEMQFGGAGVWGAVVCAAAPMQIGRVSPTAGRRMCCSAVVQCGRGQCGVGLTYKGRDVCRVLVTAVLRALNTPKYSNAVLRACTAI